MAGKEYDYDGISSRVVSPSEIGTIPIEFENFKHTEEYRREILTENFEKAERDGLVVCRLWQLLLTVNTVIIVVTFLLMMWLLFVIGPLSPYQTYGQSCRTSPCNQAHGLVCNNEHICVCPTSNSYWSWNEASCRRCPSSWSMVNGKCLFVSSLLMNWTESMMYCRSSKARLLTLTSTRIFNRISLSLLQSIVVPNTNYFLGFSEQPVDSNNWSWADGSLFDSWSNSLLCLNVTINQFDPIFRTKMNCGMFRMDECLTRYTCSRADIPFICEKS